MDRSASQATSLIYIRLVIDLQSDLVSVVERPATMVFHGKGSAAHCEGILSSFAREASQPSRGQADDGDGAPSDHPACDVLHSRVHRK